MNMQIMINSKNPFMWTGMLTTSIPRNTVSNSSSMKTIKAKNSSFHGIKYTLLSLTGVVNNFRNSMIAIITRPRLYNGAASARLCARLILHILL